MRLDKYVAFSLIIAVLIISLIISGCSTFSIGTGNQYQRKYYQGYDSLELRFMPESPPDRWYYDPYSNQNEIPIVVEVRNKGSSDSYGVLYIHGYDPHIMQVAGGNLPGPGNIRFGGTGSGFFFDISNVYIGLRGGGTSTSFGFRSPNGQLYGLNAFTQNGQFKGINIRMISGRIGYGLGQRTLSLFGTNFGWNAPIALEGDTPETPGGGLEAYEFPTYVYYLPPSLEEFRQNIMVTACFDYATRATTMVCVDPFPTSNTRKPYIPKTVNPGSGQGAPVSVSRIEQRSSSRKTVFTIYIHHNKKNALDEIYDLDSLYKCDPDSGQLVKPTDKNIVYVGYIELSGQPLVCASGGRIRLDQGGNGEITCTAEFDGLTETAYEAPLEVELWYGYSKSIYKYMTIRKV